VSTQATAEKTTAATPTSTQGASVKVGGSPCEQDADCTLATLYRTEKGCCAGCFSRPMRTDELRTLSADCANDMSGNCPDFFCAQQPTARAFCPRDGGTSGRCALETMR
jgi:hypothetical protein